MCDNGGRNQLVVEVVFVISKKTALLLAVGAQLRNNLGLEPSLHMVNYDELS